MATYTTIVQETTADRKYLAENKYNLAVAKSVSSGNGATTFNTIFQGSLLGPTMKVSWTENYGMNYTLNIPNKGAKVDIEGTWQQCNLGQGYKLNSIGDWDPNFNDPNNKKNFLNAKNEYHSDICLILGCLDTETGEYQPIFFSESKLIKTGYGAYQPQEKVQIWFGNDQETGMVIASQQSAVKEYNMSPTPTRWFNLDTKSGLWSDQNQPYPPSKLPANRGNPIVKIVTFGIAIGQSLKFVNDFQFKMDKKGWEASGSATTPSGAEYKFLIAKKKQDDKDTDDLDGDINASLKECVKDGDLPKNETWTLSPASLSEQIAP